MTNRLKLCKLALMKIALLFVVCLGLCSGLVLARTVEFSIYPLETIATHQKIKLQQGPKVFVFISPICPCSARYAPYLQNLAKDYPHTQFIMVHAYRQKGDEKVADIYNKQGIQIPIIDGSDLKLADAFKALKTPHAYVVDEKGEILFEGGVGDSLNPEKIATPFLKNALEDIKSGHKPKVAYARALGCYIQR